MPLSLRNGYRIHAQSAIAIWQGFLELLETDPGAAYELVFACRDEEYVIPPLYRRPLLRWHLVQQFTDDGYAVIHADVRAVVLSGVEGDGEHMMLREPWNLGQHEEGT